MILRPNIVVTYHYVRPHNSDGVTGITPDTFRRHIAALDSAYRCVTIEEFIEREEDEDGLALVTFDDAVSDQYVHALPILEEYQVPSVIFAPMRPYSDESDRWTTQHLLHALAQHLGWQELERRVDERAGRVEVDVELMNRLYDYEVASKRRLKTLLAFVLDQRDVRTILADINESEGLQVEDWFMSPTQLLEVQRAGHAIGGHGFDHVAYDALNPKQQAADMHRAQEIKTNILGFMPRAIAFPYGAYTDETPRIARGCGYVYCFDLGRVDAMHFEKHVVT